MLAGSFPRNIEAHPGSDQRCLPNHLSPSVRRSHLLQARRYEDILCARPRVRPWLRRPGPVSVLVLELIGTCSRIEGTPQNTRSFPSFLSLLNKRRFEAILSSLHSLDAPTSGTPRVRGRCFYRYAQFSDSVFRRFLQDGPLFA